MNQVHNAARSGSAQLQKVPAEIRPERAARKQEQAASRDRPSRFETADTIELSDASKALAWLAEQHQSGVELQLPPDKLRKLAHG